MLAAVSVTACSKRNDDKESSSQTGQTTSGAGSTEKGTAGGSDKETTNGINNKETNGTDSGRETDGTDHDANGINGTMDGTGGVLEDIEEGSKCLVWLNSEDVIEKIVLFAQ